MRAVIPYRLRRCLLAPRRLGCPYRLTGLSAASGFSAAAGLPGKMIAGFFPIGNPADEGGVPSLW